HFELHRSDDGASFEAVATIQAAGNSMQTIAYRHEDVPPFSGIWYYRLLQYDINGDERDEGTVAVAVSTSNTAITCRPNLVEDEHLFIAFAQDRTDANVSIAGIDGRMMRAPDWQWETERMIA